ncbi:D-2-hydroxyacid dehydrogenase [Alsobacter soli]|uniref:D-2-hydroxyacid dehydrogenase n=1 Tax=Alsobacter soli TaxID=2109933 RepID=A0A2T1HYV1_9HYPH|nr:D-2-hydroxyacid dehydrogenase [Alsobacter soli]PSC06873.1 D-2-hydroxyacid dehydrogenase [Alsobacter soli]
MSLIPDRSSLTIAFAHGAYQFADAFAQRSTGIRHFQVSTPEALIPRLPEVDVLVVSFLWRDVYLEHAPRLRFVQSISAGVDQFPKDLLRSRGVRLASAQGGNERAVAEHAMSLLLSLTRQLHLARDHQAKHHWRPMIADRTRREDELEGKTLVIVGMGRIGSRLARLAKAFDMRVIGVKRDPSSGAGAADEVVATERLRDALAQADVVALTCPLTPETQGLIGAAELAAMKPSAFLINVARGKVVDEAALIDTLAKGRIAGAGLDCFHEEPLPANSPLWAMPHVIVTPHSAGETRRYETNVLEILMDNLGRLWRGGSDLRNAVV